MGNFISLTYQFILNVNNFSELMQNTKVQQKLDTSYQDNQIRQTQQPDQSNQNSQNNDNFIKTFYETPKLSFPFGEGVPYDIIKPMPNFQIDTVENVAKLENGYGQFAKKIINSKSYNKIFFNVRTIQIAYAYENNYIYVLNNNAPGCLKDGVTIYIDTPVGFRYNTSTRLYEIIFISKCNSLIGQVRCQEYGCDSKKCQELWIHRKSFDENEAWTSEHWSLVELEIEYIFNNKIKNRFNAMGVDTTPVFTLSKNSFIY